VQRLDAIVSAIQAFASLHFEARAPLSPSGDIVDALAAGVNFLGEELEASFNEVERRVAGRTAELAAATRELGRRALHDDLTGLPNRALLFDHLSHRLQQAGRRAEGFGLLFIDIDRFKLVNDTLGHAAGDRLLVEVAARLRTATRVGDTSARIGGDEFVVLLDDVTSAPAALTGAERVSEALCGSYELGAGPWPVVVSIGAVTGGGGLDTPDAVLAAADAAMYSAKQQGGARCVLYDGGAPARRTTDPALRAAGEVS
jgi:diguanylate cyclase (GGDEF)-like protein